MRARPGLAVVGAACAWVALAGAAPAASAATPTADSSALLAALGPNGVAVAGATATFVARPPAGTPTAVSATTVPAFPTVGSYVVLSTGDASLADTANTSPKTTGDNGGGAVRGGDERDVVTLRVDFTTSTPACVVTFAYQFLSDEYPEWVGTTFGDAFVAELDASTWNVAGGEVTAPDAFAVEAVGRTPMTAQGATGTTYDGGMTGPDVARVVVPTPGAHSLFLSVFDVGDNRYDTTVFVDNLVLC